MTMASFETLASGAVQTLRFVGRRPSVTPRIDQDPSTFASHERVSSGASNR